MSEEIMVNDDMEVDAPVMDEAASLKQRLDMMGVKYHHKAGVETLRKLLQDALNPPVEEEAVPTARTQKMSARKEALLKATALIRCQITCMNPHKRDWQGEIFTAGNGIIGTVKKFVPYNCEAANSFHIPRILVSAMRDRKYLQTRSIKTTSGARQESFYVPEFVVVELPPLTKAELDQLAQDQRNAAGN